MPFIKSNKIKPRRNENAIGRTIQCSKLFGQEAFSQNLPLKVMLQFYLQSMSRAILILDVNLHTRAMYLWKGSNRQIVSMDIDPGVYNPDIVADNREMPGVELSTPFAVSLTLDVFRCAVIGPQGRVKSSKRFDDRFLELLWSAGKKTDGVLVISTPALF